jgi:hypothetical protein
VELPAQLEWKRCSSSSCNLHLETPLSSNTPPVKCPSTLPPALTLQLAPTTTDPTATTTSTDRAITAKKIDRIDRSLTVAAVPGRLRETATGIDRLKTTEGKEVETTRRVDTIDGENVENELNKAIAMNSLDCLSSPAVSEAPPARQPTKTQSAGKMIQFILEIPKSDNYWYRWRLVLKL